MKSHATTLLCNYKIMTRYFISGKVRKVFNNATITFNSVSDFVNVYIYVIALPFD